MDLDTKEIEKALADDIQKHLENRDIAAILLYLQMVVLDRCTLDDAIARFAVDSRPVCEDKGGEQWCTGEEYTLVPRRERLMITPEQSIAFTEKAISVIQKVAEKVFK